MRTCVVGAGGIGMVYTARLVAVLADGDERHMTLVTRRPTARDALARGLVVVRPDTPEDVVHVDALLVGDVPSHTQDVVILAAKSHDNEELLPVIDEMLAPGGVCLSVQNGVTNAASLHAVLGPGRGVQGATAVVATQLADDRVLEASVFATWLPATMPHVSALAAWMHEAGLQPVLVDDVDRIQWHKAALGGVGPISVVLDEPLGVVVTRPEARRVLRAMTAETVAVANAVGVALELADELDAQQRLVDSLPRDAMSSMYNDYRTGRRPELEERVGEIIRLADAHGVPVPVTRTVHELASARFTACAIVNDTVDTVEPPG